MTAVIDIRDLHKHFGHVRALDGLDLTVEEGEIHGFLGPNGAGKSTTIRILLGVLRATSGQVRTSRLPGLAGGCSAVIPGPTPSRYTARSPTCQAM